MRGTALALVLLAGCSTTTQTAELRSSRDIEVINEKKLPLLVDLSPNDPSVMDLSYRVDFGVPRGSKLYAKYEFRIVDPGTRRVVYGPHVIPVIPDDPVFRVRREGHFRVEMNAGDSRRLRLELGKQGSFEWLASVACEFDCASDPNRSYDAAPRD